MPGAEMPGDGFAQGCTWQKLPDWMLATLPCFHDGGSAKW